MSDITEGTKLFWPAQSGRSWSKDEYKKVTKVGRKWLTLEFGHRADKETLRIDGAYERAQLYRSEAEYREKQELRRLWREFLKMVDNHRWDPPVSKFQIEKAAIALGFELKACRTSPD